MHGACSQLTPVLCRLLSLLLLLVPPPLALVPCPAGQWDTGLGRGALPPQPQVSSHKPWWSLYSAPSFIFSWLCVASLLRARTLFDVKFADAACTLRFRFMKAR